MIVTMMLMISTMTTRGLMRLLLLTLRISDKCRAKHESGVAARRHTHACIHPTVDARNPALPIIRNIP